MRTPGFWSDETSRLAALLSPLGAVYGGITRRRLAKAHPFVASVPVVCIGNITAGGSGKTPVVQALVREALARGINVHCLSRGYGGSMQGPVRVDPGRHLSTQVGDEPLLLAQTAPTWVARDRAAAAKAAIAAGAKLLIMDDGLQSPALHKTMSMLVIDGGIGLGNNRLIPAGPLRETLAAALPRLHSIVIVGRDISGISAKLPSRLPIITVRIVPRTSLAPGKKIVAFAGLGRPEKFRQTVQDMGGEIVAWRPFADHHPYTADDLSALTRISKELNAHLVTTEKDFMRLPLSFRNEVDTIAIDLLPDPANAFAALIESVMNG